MQTRFNQTGVSIVSVITALLFTFFLVLALSVLPNSLAQEAARAETAALTGSAPALSRQISIYEPATTASSQANWMVTGPQANSHFGISVAYVGDIDGDGYQDAVVGASGYSGEFPDQGEIAVYYGTPDGLSDWPQVTFTLPIDGAEYGRAVAGAGDVNNDGFADVLTSAPFSGSDRAGVVYIDYGSPDGFQGYDELLGQMSGDRFGFALAAGDINNDGYTDVLIGAPGYQGEGMPDTGAVFLFYGGPDGLNTEPAWIVESFEAGMQLGYALAVGDFNGDGFADIAIGAKTYDSNFPDSGAVFVYYGSGQGPGGGSQTTPDSADWTFVGEGAGHFFGAALAAGGDVNGNGFDDLVVGAPGFGFNNDNYGALYGFWGSDVGLTARRV
jgi:hypothetical protein